MTVINIVLFGNVFQSIDAGTSTFETFGQMSPGSHVLKFNAGFSQPFLNVDTPSTLDSLPFGSLPPRDRFFLGTGFHFQSLS